MPLSDMFEIGEWLPDQPVFGAGGASVVTNALTNRTKYKPVKGLSAQSDALGGACLGAYSYLQADGNATTFAAFDTTIKKLITTTWEDVTNVGGPYATAGENVWNFTQFGDIVIATNKDDSMQKFQVGTDTDFSDLITAGVDVKCGNFGIINNFLVCVDVADTDGNTPNRVRWSPFNDPAGNWASSQSTQADFEDVQVGNPGTGMAVVGGQNYGIVLFQNAIHRMEYVGPPLIFTFDLMAENIGAFVGQSVASNGERTFFVSEKGFQMLTLEGLVNIGDEKVDDFFFNTFDIDNAHLMRAIIDPSDKRVYWTYPSTAGGGVNDKIITYSWIDKRFTLIDLAVQQFFRFLADGFTLEEVGASFPDLDVDVPFTLDSRFWKGGTASLGVIDSDQKLAGFDGANLTAEFITQEVQINPSGLTYVDSIMPVVEGGTTEVRIGSRKLLTDSNVFSGFAGTSAETGEVNVQSENRYHRAGIRLTGAWTAAHGMRYRAEEAGGV